MTLKKSKQKSRWQARKIYELFYDTKIERGLHLHHIDGDCFNNDIENLIVCTPTRHWELHIELGDKFTNGNFILTANNRLGLVGPNTGKKFSKEWRENMSKSHKGREVWNTGIKCPKEMVDNIKKGTQKWLWYCGKYGVFKSSRDAANRTGLHRTTIQRRVKNPKFPEWYFEPNPSPLKPEEVPE